jgi:hypothetical protein
MLIDNNNTREALVDNLEKLLEQKDLSDRVEARATDKDKEMKQYREAGRWLLDLTIKAVKEALRTNELIDY